MTKTTITRKAALEFAIANLDNDEVNEVLGKMLAQLNKPRKAAVSKARKINENLAEWVYDNAPTDAITTKDVVALGNPDIATTQKASAVLRVGAEMGYFEKVVDRKKVTYNKIAE